MILQAIRQFVFEEEGATALEYAILSSFIAAAIVTALFNVSQMVIQLFMTAIDGFPGGTGGGSGS